MLIALALVLAGQPAWRAETLRARIDKMHANKGVEVRDGHNNWNGGEQETNV